MRIIGYSPECTTAISNNIHDYTDFYTDKPSGGAYKMMNQESITKSRVFPNRYIDKHTWKTYGYKTNYVSSYEERSKCIPKKMKLGNVSLPSRREQTGSAALVGKVYKARDEFLTNSNANKGDKTVPSWNIPYGTSYVK